MKIYIPQNEPAYSPEVKALIACPDEMISAKDIAPIVRMHSSVIIHLARTGQWDFSKYIVSGKRVKFFRVDFLRQGGWIQ